ncbi:delta-aminolevulinic acid dehydratase [bacterium]|nr:delta-aminolevulinic acid dehydratase [bacterium]
MSFEINSFLKLKNYCEKEQYKGWDPYDGLNSAIFRALPFKHWDLARLAWIQGFKRSPVNLRKLLLVPKQYNAKGIGLFLLGYCNLYELALKGNKKFGKIDDLLSKIHELAILLEDLQISNFSGACWGYNFDWQSRRLFLFPAYTPTIVATTFCAEALFKAYELTREEKYKTLALSSAHFVINDLDRTPHHSGFLFSYSPLKGNDTVYNASLLGAKLLSLCYKYSKNKDYKDIAEQAVRAACDGQNKDGSWVYGMLPTQTWIDSFHTGYNLDAISMYQNCTSDYQFSSNLEKGFIYYIEKFFQNDGTPKYYSNKTYPIDIHCPAQLFVTISKLGEFTAHKKLVTLVANWSIKEMQSEKGYFYYQLKKGWSSKIPYMRWSNAFMFNALTFYFKEHNSS